MCTISYGLIIHMSYDLVKRQFCRKIMHQVMNIMIEAECYRIMFSLRNMIECSSHILRLPNDSSCRCCLSGVVLYDYFLSFSL